MYPGHFYAHHLPACAVDTLDVGTADLNHGRAGQIVKKNSATAASRKAAIANLIFFITGQPSFFISLELILIPS
jgi:hypothetical protein